MDKVIKICLFHYGLLLYYVYYCENESHENRFATGQKGIVLLVASARRKLAGFYNG